MLAPLRLSLCVQKGRNSTKAEFGLNLKRVNTRGIRGANKHVLMAAMVYNLKKLLKFNRKSPKIIAQAIPINESRLGKFLFFLKYKFLCPILQF